VQGTRGSGRRQCRAMRLNGATGLCSIWVRYKAKSFSPGDLRPGFFFHTLSTRSMAFGESLDEFQHVTANGTAADSVVRLRERKVVLVRQQFSCL